MPPASTMHPVVLLHSSLLIAVLHCSRVEVGGNVAKRDDRALAESEWKHCYAVTVISSPQTLESESEHQKIKRQVWMSQAKCGEIVRSLEYMRMKVWKWAVDKKEQVHETREAVAGAVCTYRERHWVEGWMSDGTMDFVLFTGLGKTPAAFLRRKSKKQAIKSPIRWWDAHATYKLKHEKSIRCIPLWAGYFGSK